jgi:hypothetical protein
VERIAELVKEKGEPDWAETLRWVETYWPESAPLTVDTIKKTVRRLAKS